MTYAVKNCEIKKAVSSRHNLSNRGYIDVLGMVILTYKLILLLIQLQR